MRLRQRLPHVVGGLLIACDQAVDDRGLLGLVLEGLRKVPFRHALFERNSLPTPLNPRSAPSAPASLTDSTDSKTPRFLFWT